jgi:hypothetical protein
MSIKNYFDMETIPDQRPGAFERYLDQVSPPGNYKKQETIDAWMLENAEAIALQDYCKTGLNGLHGEICSIAFAIEDRDIIAVTRGLDGIETEWDLLDSFWNSLTNLVRSVTKAREHADWAKLEWIGHNIIDFDLRFLKQRSIVNGIKPPFLVPADARHGGGWVFDTMKEWCGSYGSNRYVKQDELVEVLGIVVPDTIAQDIDGGMVWDLFKAGEYETIGEYNKLDVHKVREIHRRMCYV